MAASSSAPATAASSSSAAWSTRCAARSKCRTASSSAMPACRPRRRIEFRVGIHLGDVVEESDGDLMGDGVNIAARLEGIREAGRDLSVRGRLSPGQGAARSRGQRSRPDPTQEHRRADPGLFARSRQARAGEARAGPSARKIRPAAPLDGRLAVRQYRRRPGAGAFRRRGHGEPDDRPLTDTRRRRDRPQYGVHLQRQAARS